MLSFARAPVSAKQFLGPSPDLYVKYATLSLVRFSPPLLSFDSFLTPSALYFSIPPPPHADAMLFQSLPSLSALLFLLLTLVAPSPLALARNIPAAHKNLVRADAKDWTNARRLAAGLPPHPPRHMKRGTPTEPNVVKRHAVPSPSPSAALASIQKLYVDHFPDAVPLSPCPY